MLNGISDFDRPETPEGVQQPANKEQNTEPEQQEQDLGVLDYASDIGRGAVNGVIGFGESVANLGIDVANGVKWLFHSNDETEDGDDGYFKKFVLPKLKQSETFVGKLTEGVVQFAVGFAAGGGVLGMAGNLGKLATGVQWWDRLKKVKLAASAVQGAVADFISFNGQEERLSNLIESNPHLANPITAWLAADPDDSGLTGRLKNTLEGLGLGAASDLLMGGLKTLKGGRLLKANAADQAARQLVEDGLDDMIEAGSKIDVDDAGKLKGILKDLPVDEAIKELDKEKVKAGLKGWANKFKEILNSGKSVDDAVVGATESYGFSHHTFGVDANTEEAMKFFESVIHEELERKPFKQKQSIGEIKRLTNELGLTGADAVMKATEHLNQTGLNSLSAKLYAAKKVFADQSETLHKLLTTASNNPTDAVWDDAADLLTKMVSHGENTAKAWGEVGRTLRMGREGVADLPTIGTVRDYTNLLEKIKNAPDKRKALERVAPWLIAAKGNVKKIMRLLDETPWSKAEKVRHELWINSLLSSPRGFFVDVLSTGMNTVLRPVEMMVGGALTGNKEAMEKGWRIASYYRRSLFDVIGLSKSAMDVPESSARKAWQAFKGDAGSVIDRVGQKVDVSFDRGVSAETLGVDQNSFLGKAVDWLGSTARIPTRLRLASDEFYKQVSSRGYIYQEAMAEAAERGLNVADAGKLFEKKLADAFEDGGRLVHEKALAFARESTFTGDLTGVGKSIQNMVYKHPILRPVLPFIRTPMNIVSEVWQRTPGLQKLSGKAKEVMSSGDPAAIAEFRGRQSTGAVLYSAAAMLAADGLITGGGPKNWRERKIKQDSGWQPYSFVVTKDDGTKEYIQFNRLDPFGMFFGIAADIAAMSGEAEEQELMSLAGASMNVLSQNLLSKTYMKGLTDALTALNDGGPAAAQWARNFIGSHVPALVRDLGRFSPIPGVQMPWLDEAGRDVRTWTDSIMQRIPGLSQTLAPRRNILGEVMPNKEGWGPDILSPFAFSKSTSNAALNELADLDHGFAMPRQTIGNVNLTEYKNANGQDAYDRLLELTGQLTLGGNTLSEALNKLVTSPAYKKLSKTAVDGVESPRIDAVRKVLSRYRLRAMWALRKEFGNLDNDLRMQNAQNRLAKHPQLQALLSQ